MKFKIVVPTYNTEGWIGRCLLSIAVQSFKDFECAVINDASTDRTKEVIEGLEFIKDDERFSVIHNQSNVKALKNIVDGFNFLEAKKEPESVLMIIDGDDFLFSDQSLAIVAQYYQQIEGLLLTYGNWIGHPIGSRSNCRKYDNNVIDNSLYRYTDFHASHLRTFKSKLWYSINDEDLRDESGNYFEAGWDVAFMMPMMEMAQERHRFIEQVLYCYNMHNPISDFRSCPEKQTLAVELTRKRKPYKRLEI
jgi:glycosyltransferase involved in cell wall biosynthesis